eukprot:c5873_g1_i1.p1 GENE.c5873_g1_i1~~c5873_g1_i1.p1  ORF type:complete len:485 (-),score=129.39 c5873_g1_i1:114-1394(-)
MGADVNEEEIVDTMSPSDSLNVWGLPICNIISKPNSKLRNRIKSVVRRLSSTSQKLQPTEMLFLTCNMAQVEAECLSLWISVVKAFVKQSNANIVFFSFQCLAPIPDDIDPNPPVVSLLLKHLSSFVLGGFVWEKESLCLGTLCLVKQTVVKQKVVELWDFKNESTHDLKLRASEDKRFFVHHSFPRALVDPSQMSPRPGYLQTRWIIRGQSIDVVNVRLPPNGACRFDPQVESAYALNRRKAFQYMSERLTCGRGGVMLLCGDFNFRIDTNSLVKAVCGADFHVQTAAGVTQVFESPTRTVPVVSIANEMFQTHGKMNGMFTGLFLELRKFDTEHTAVICDDSASLMQFNELPVTFPPTYPFPSTQVASNHFPYAPISCPSWCDRIFVSTKAEDVMGQPSYGVIGLDFAVGLHKPVYLKFTYRSV